MTVCIIPARGGSRRLPGKNKRLFHGKPIIAYSIETAKKCSGVTEVVVSTDDDEIRDIAWEYGARYLEREPEYARDEVGTKAVIARCCEQLDLPPGEEVLCVYPCAPLLHWEDLYWMAAFLVLKPAYFVVAVGTEPLADAGAAYCALAAHWRSEWLQIYSNRTAYYTLPPERVCDVNTEDDWKRAEQLYAQMMEAKHDPR